MIPAQAVEAAARVGYTDGYGWVESGPVAIVTDLRQLDWLMEVLAETTAL